MYWQSGNELIFQMCAFTITIDQVYIFFYFDDLQHLREDLARIDESWAAARYDSLPHVVRLLTSKDREAELQDLKEQSEIIEDVVDEVVHAYHSGFNRAIQNYSQVPYYFLFKLR